MEITIEPVVNIEDEVAMSRIREQVFERESGISLARLAAVNNPSSFHLLARVEPDGAVVAALSVVETSADRELHAGFGLEFPSVARVARYTQLAVLKPYRGLNIPLMLVLEAHRRFVAPGKFDYTWLLFDAERAASSLMCKWLAFTPGERTFPSEYGMSRALVRDERVPQSEQATWYAELFIEQMLKAFLPMGHSLVRQATGA